MVEVALGEELSAKEAAKLAGVSRVTLYRWLRKGTLAGVKNAGGNYRISRAAVLAAVNMTQAGPRVDPQESDK